MQGRVYFLTEHTGVSDDPLPQPSLASHSWKEEFDIFWNQLLKPEFRIYWAGPESGAPLVESVESTLALAHDALEAVAKSNFCIGIFYPDELDWVKLSPTGNRRERRWRDENGEWKVQKLHP